MADTRHPTAADPVELRVHNGGSSTVEIRLVVHGDGAVERSVALEGGETDGISAPAGSSVEVHTPDGIATATATRGAVFVVREGRVLVVPK